MADLLNFLKPAPPAVPPAPNVTGPRLALTLPGAVQMNQQPAPAQAPSPAPAPLPTLRPPVPQAPMPAPQLAPQQAPQQMPPLEYVNPYAAISGGRSSVLSDDPRQAQLGQAFDKMIQSVIDGPDARQAKEMAASKVFSGAAAALGGILGGGYAQGGLQVLKDAQQQVHDAKAERHQQQQDAMTGLKTLTDIVSNTSPYSQKALAAQVRGALTANDQQIKGFKAQTDANYKAGTLDARNHRTDVMQGHYNNLDLLKQRGLDLTNSQAAAKLQQAWELQHEKMSLDREIAQMRAESSKYSTDKSFQARMNELEQKKDALSKTQHFMAERFDSEMEAKLGRRDSMGNLVYQGVSIPKLADQFANTPDENGRQPQQQESSVPDQATPQQPQKSAPTLQVPTSAHSVFRTINKLTGLGTGNKDMFMQEAANRGYSPDQAAQLYAHLGGK